MKQQYFKKTTHLFHTERRKAKREKGGSHDDRVSDELRGWVSVVGGMIKSSTKNSKRGIVFFTKSSSMIQTAKTWKNHKRAGWRRLSCHVKKICDTDQFNVWRKENISRRRQFKKSLSFFASSKFKKRESAAFVYWIVTYFLSRMFLIARSATPLLALLD